MGGYYKAKTFNACCTHGGPRLKKYDLLVLMMYLNNVDYVQLFMLALGF
jgi:hypothetical protein